MSEEYKMTFKDKPHFENAVLLASYTEGTPQHSKRRLRQVVETIKQEFYQLFKIELIMLDIFIGNFTRKVETKWEIL